MVRPLEAVVGFTQAAFDEAINASAAAAPAR
jgi:hypothetical protein